MQNFNLTRYLFLIKEVILTLIFASILFTLLVLIGELLLNRNNIVATVQKVDIILSNLESSTEKLNKTLDNVSATLDNAKAFSDIVLTVDRAKSLNNYFDVLESNAHITTTNLQFAVAESLETSRDIRNKLNPLLLEATDTVREGKNLVIEINHQVKQNGDQLHSLLNQGETLLAKSEKDLLSTLENINKTTNGLQLLTNDPELSNLIKQSSLTMSNIQVTTKELADLSTHFIEPIVRPRKTKGLNKYLLQPTLKVLRILNGSTNVLYLISRVN